MTNPRMEDDLYCCLTRRDTVQRQFRLTPDAKMINDYMYCLGISADKYEISVHTALLLGNSHRLMATPNSKKSDYPKFLKQFHADLTKIIRTRHDTKGSIWTSKRRPDRQILTIEDFAIEFLKLRTKLVRSGLVEDPDDWPGLSISAENLGNFSFTATRPAELGEETDRPEKVTIRFVAPNLPSRSELETKPDESGNSNSDRRNGNQLTQTITAQTNSDSIQAVCNTALLCNSDNAETLSTAQYHRSPTWWRQFRNRLKRLEHAKLQEARLERKKRGLGYVDLDKVRSQQPHETRKLVDKIVSDQLITIKLVSDLEADNIRLSSLAHKNFKKRYKKFLKEYREALSRWLRHEPNVVFPKGTYMMRVTYNQPCRE